MKTRQGFVSNSSTSSFICCVCGFIEAGMDVSFSDVGMFECKNGHIMHVDCVDAGDVKNKLVGYLDIEDGDRYQVPKESCPVCMLAELTDEDELLWWRSQGNRFTKQQILNDIKTRFVTYDKFMRENTVADE